MSFNLPLFLLAYDFQKPEVHDHKLGGARAVRVVKRVVRVEGVKKLEDLDNTVMLYTV